MPPVGGGVKSYANATTVDMGVEAVVLGKAIKAIREQYGLSQEELAAFAGINRTSFGEIERGETNPTFETLCRVAAALQIPLSGLIKKYEEQNRE